MMKGMRLPVLHTQLGDIGCVFVLKNISLHTLEEYQEFVINSGVPQTNPPKQKLACCSQQCIHSCGYLANAIATEVSRPLLTASHDSSCIAAALLLLSSTAAVECRSSSCRLSQLRRSWRRSCRKLSLKLVVIRAWRLSRLTGSDR